MSQTPFCRLPRFTLSRTRQLAGWQVCSLLLTATGFTSQRLADRGIDAPTAQSLATYVCLLLHGLRRPPLSAADAARISRPWWQWLLLAFADVEGNYLIVRAYQYTDITSVTLLDAFAVPVVMVISSIALHARYSRWQLVGVVVCLVGLIVLVTTDTLLQPMHQCVHVVHPRMPTIRRECRWPATFLLTSDISSPLRLHSYGLVPGNMLLDRTASLPCLVGGSLILG